MDKLNVDPSRVRNPIDFDKAGRQAGYLHAPISRNTGGWSTVEIPIVSVKNGSGPTILLTGGIHGDEYEGQIAISRLAATLDPARVQGRVIMIPAFNLPAVLNDTRLSPIDNLDMNRCFPGNARGTFSEMLAHFLASHVLPYADVSVDIHTAGHGGEMALSSNMHYLPDAKMREKTMAVAAAFGAPYNSVFWGVDEGATFTSAVERQGSISIGTELGGYGRVSIEGVRIAKRGVENVLKHFEVIEGKVDTTQRDGSTGTRHMMVRDLSYYAFSPANGLFEPANLVGEEVRAGQPAGWLHFVEDIDRDPIEILYPRDGVLWCAAGPGRVNRGSALAVLMNDYDDQLAAG
jgi:N-alpha-acetyl-L-2,4-diaminobutyrate deacetylase